MARTTRQLTNTEVKQAKAKSKEYNLADGQGLYLRIKTNGTKLWLFQYFKPFTNKRTNTSLGQYPALLLADARKVAENYRSLLAKNIDPREEREREARESSKAQLNTLEAIGLEWLELKKDDVSPTYAFKIQQGLENHIFPRLGKLPIHKINAPETISLLKPIAEAGHLVTVRKVCRWINEIMVHAVNTGVIYSNPLSGIIAAFKKPKARNMPTLTPSELPVLMKALDKARITMVTKLLAEWQLHTMVRPAEAAATKWDEIDLDEKVWRIPAGRMKTNKAHTVPLSRQALEVLETMKPISAHREYVFPSSSDPKKPASSQTVNAMLKRIGFKDKLVSHGFRSLASTTLNEQQFDPDIIEVALAHLDKNTIRAKYNRAEYLEQRRVMMQWWSDHIEEAATGKAITKGKKQLRAIK
jgi:integrase